MAAYAQQTDLMLGDLALSPSINTEDYLRSASMEIDARVGEVYAVPLVGMLAHHALLIKLIAARLASGRLIMAVAVGGEDRQLHAYGQSLVAEAYADIDRIVSGRISLTGVTEIGVDQSSNLPGIINRDSGSAVEMFEDSIYRGADLSWEPGGPR